MSEIVDKLVGATHVALYQETDGELGDRWRGSDILLLTTIGNQSGRAVTTPLVFTTDGDDFVVVASKGGAPEDPAWFKNLQANGDAEVQIRADHFPVRMRTAQLEERARLWGAMVASWRDYEHYQRKTDREIPVVVLERR
jgi:deazaflavin-dependent oxidoreductase (nitroreductase family)